MKKHLTQTNKWLNNYNDAKVSIPSNFVETGYDVQPLNYNGSWNGQFQNGEKISKYRLPQDYVQPSQQINNLYDAWGNMGEDIVYSGTPEYEQAKRDKTFKDVPNQLDEITVSPYNKQFPYYEQLTPNEKKYLRENLNSNDPISRQLKARATDGQGFNADKAKDFAMGYLRDLPLASLQAPQSTMVEGIEALRGNEYNFESAITPGSQRFPSETWNIENPAIALATDVLADPFLVGTVMRKPLQKVLQHTGDLVDNLGNKYLPNAHKINPLASKLNRYNRIVGEDAVNDLESFPANKASVFEANPHWLKGYKQVEVPKNQNIDFNNYLTQKEAAHARGQRMINQEHKFVGQDNEKLIDEFKNAAENHQDNLTAREWNIKHGDLQNPESLGVNKYGETVVYSDAPLSNANKARTAAHETGHYYINTFEEGKEWNSFFDFSSQPQKIRDYLGGKGMRGRGTIMGDEIRERAAQLKDYIAQKNNIPLNKDFKITNSQLDDALKNYVKDTKLDNNMTSFISSLKDKKGFLNAMNKYALTPAVGLGIVSQLEQKKQGGIIKNNRGQWDNEGEITQIGGGNITMKPDPLTGKSLTKPLLGISDKGEKKIMYPNKDYKFKNAKFVTEYPITKNWLNKYS